MSRTSKALETRSRWWKEPWAGWGRTWEWLLYIKVKRGCAIDGGVGRTNSESILTSVDLILRLWFHFSEVLAYVGFWLIGIFCAILIFTVGSHFIHLENEAQRSFFFFFFVPRLKSLWSSDLDRVIFSWTSCGSWQGCILCENLWTKYSFCFKGGKKNNRSILRM